MTPPVQSYNFMSSRILHVIVIFVSVPLCFSVPISIQNVHNVDVANNSLVVYERLSLMPSDSVCRYKAQTYLAGDVVPTEEPCLRCQCKKQAVVCKLRICTEVVPDAPPPGCVVVHKAKSCCPKVVCPESKKITREQRLSTGTLNSTTVPGFPFVTGEGFCLHEGTIYAEGSAMKSNSACDYCFCIRGQMKCSQPQCVIPLNGCKPHYRSFACCPTNYDCTESNTSSIIQSTTLSTAVPSFLKGCRIMSRFIYEGEPVLPIHLEPDKYNMCQTCFCLGGTVHCRPLECARPLNGCQPITEEGHCCPSRYECPNTSSNSTDFSGKVQENLLSLDSKPAIRNEPSNERQLNSSGTIEQSWTTSPPDLSNASSSNVTPVDMTTPYSIPLSLDSGAADSELLFNKLRLDIGSREDRQNRNQNEMTANKASYEDDERDYLFGVPSLEAIDHELISKMAFERLLPEPERRSTVKALKSIGPSTAPEDAGDSTGESWTESGDGNEIRETTTTEVSVVREVPQNSSVTPFELHGNISGEGKEQIPNSTSSNGGEEIHHSTDSEKKSNMLRDVPTTTEMRILETPTTAPPATVANLHFIPFSVEDALVLPPLSNNASYNSSTLPLPASTINIPYGHSDTVSKSNLNPPLLPNPYYHSPTPGFPRMNHLMREVKKDSIQVVPSPEHLRDSFRNVIMDVPVSTSLYNNGYYQNGIITNSAAQELNVSTFPGQVFDDSSAEESLSILQNPTDDKDPQFKSTTIPTLSLSSKTSTKVSSNPSRTYSKFGVHDSPSHRHHATTSKNEENQDVLEKESSRTSLLSSRDYSSGSDLDPFYEDDKTLESFANFEGGESNEFPKGISSASPKVDENPKPIRISSDSNPTAENYVQPFPSYRHTDPPSAPPTSGGSTQSQTLRPVVTFPFRVNQAKPKEPFANIGLKLSGCNIYGKMYKVGNVIPELSGPCIQCQCTEIGVQCSQQPC